MYMAYLLGWGLFAAAPGTHVTRQAPNGDWITVRHEAGTIPASNWWSDAERAKRGRTFEFDEVEPESIQIMKKALK